MRHDPFEEQDAMVVNPSTEPSIAELIDLRLSRRAVLKGMAAGGAFGLFGCATPRGPDDLPDGSAPITFAEVGRSTGDNHQVAPGYNVQVLLRQGDPIRSGAPLYRPAQQTAAEQEVQFGTDNDFIAYMPLRIEVFRSASVPIWAALCVVLGAAVIARVHFEIPWQHMMGDPAVVTGWPFYLGFVSNVSAVLWAAAASLFLFSFCVHRSSSGDAEWGRFLLCSGLFIGLLGLDDLFMLHEQVFPNYLSISQSLVVASYAGLAALYVARFAAVIAQTAYPVFVAAIAMLAVSAALDQIQDHFSTAFVGVVFCEDAAKLLGIGTWLSYAIHTSAALLRREHPVLHTPLAVSELDLADEVRHAFGHFFRRGEPPRPSSRVNRGLASRQG